MLQRIQTIYLLLTLIANLLLIFVFYIWLNASLKKVFVTDSYLYLPLVLSSLLLTVFSIFSYKKRKSQFMMGRLNIILNFVLLGFFVSASLNLSGETSVSEKGIGVFVPIFSIVCLALANKAIKKDEDLVKSVDRLR